MIMICDIEWLSNGLSFANFVEYWLIVDRRDQLQEVGLDVF